MKKIATHNSFTGEKGAGILSALVSPFSKCQRRDLVQQHAAGCRLFDLRVKLHKGLFVAAHGQWKAKRLLVDMMTELDKMAAKSPEKTYYMLTYEGVCDDVKTYDRFWRLHKAWEKNLKNLECVQVSIKKPEWHVIWSADDMPPYRQCFEVLDNYNWKSILPVPRLWAKLYGRVDFDDEYFRMVDFF